MLFINNSEYIFLAVGFHYEMLCHNYWPLSFIVSNSLLVLRLPPYAEGNSSTLSLTVGELE
jgi:hypothetical protein